MVFWLICSERLRCSADRENCAKVREIGAEKRKQSWVEFLSLRKKGFTSHFQGLKWYSCNCCTLNWVHPLFRDFSPSCQLEGSVKRNQTSQKSSQISQKRNGLKKVRILTLRNFLAWETFFRMRRTCIAGLFYVFGCEKFCKHIMAGLFGFFLLFTIF